MPNNSLFQTPPMYYRDYTYWIQGHHPNPRGSNPEQGDYYFMLRLKDAKGTSATASEKSYPKITAANIAARAEIDRLIRETELGAMTANEKLAALTQVAELAEMPVVAEFAQVMAEPTPAIATNQGDPTEKKTRPKRRTKTEPKTAQPVTNSAVDDDDVPF